MASLTSVGISTAANPASCRRSQLGVGTSGLKLVTFSSQWRSLSSPQLKQASLRLRLSCSAKPETVEKVCNIVKKQLVLPAGACVTGESTFSALGADSLDTVEIMMGIEEAFGISVEEESAQHITTVQDAADLIEKLAEAKSN